MITIALVLAAAQTAPAPRPASPTSPTVIQRVATPDEDVPISSRVARSADYVTADDRYAAWTMHRFADCLVRTRRGGMVDFLATPLNSVEQARLVRDMIGWRSMCLRARAMRIDNILLRGAVAEALYRRERRGLPTGEIDAAPELAAADPGKSPPAALSRSARCVVRGNPGGVKALVEAKPGTGAETAALAALQPAYSACLAPGQKPEKHPLMLRGALAEAFYLHWRGVLNPTVQPAQATP